MHETILGHWLGNCFPNECPASSETLSPISPEFVVGGKCNQQTSDMMFFSCADLVNVNMCGLGLLRRHLEIVARGSKFDVVGLGSRTWPSIQKNIVLKTKCYDIVCVNTP